MSLLEERMTERARVVLELSLREALSFGHNYIGTEHILLGLVREEEGLAGMILEGLGLERPKIRGEVLRVMGSPCQYCGERKRRES